MVKPDVAPYLHSVLPSLRNRQGRPNARVRLAALTVVFGMVLASAPLLVIPVVATTWRTLDRAIPGF